MLMVRCNSSSSKVGIAYVKGDMRKVYSDPLILESTILSALKGFFAGDFSTANPFSGVVKPGSTVLIKPNWVLHENWCGEDVYCLYTQPALVAAAVRLIAKASPSRIIIGDSPVQNCDLSKLLTDAAKKMITEAAGAVPVEFIDFRRTVTERNDFARGVSTNRRPLDRYILFDLGQDSLMEPLCAPSDPFRITNYDPRELAKTHHRGRHQYLLCREVFEADVVINMPKLKSHKKAGMTGALKNLVGINGSKDFLPHHRVGGSGWGGDCYRGRAPLKRLAEWFMDRANRHLGKSRYSFWRSFSEAAIAAHRRISPYGDAEMEGSWYGNDTVWRMTLDLNRLLLYGRTDGSLSDQRQRVVYTLTDALMAGDGEGPLSPKPLALGLVTFSSDSAVSDFVNCALMHFDWKKIPQVREAFGAFKYKLTDVNPGDVEVAMDGQPVSLEEAALKYGRPFVASVGWQDHVEDIPLRRKAHATVY